MATEIKKDKDALLQEALKSIQKSYGEGSIKTQKI